MSACIYCGEELYFRYIRGVLTPLHESGSCTQAPYSGNVSSSFTSNAAGAFGFDDFCRSQPCEYCSAPIFFIRHNGGCLWVNSLGWPWPKHACYYKQIATEVHDKYVDASRWLDFPLLGIVLYAGRNANSATDSMIIKLTDGRKLDCRVEYVLNPHKLVGLLVIVDLKKEYITIPDIKKYSILHYTIDGIIPKEVGEADNNSNNSAKTTEQKN